MPVPILHPHPRPINCSEPADPIEVVETDETDTDEPTEDATEDAE